MINTAKLPVLILAGGQGTRLKSKVSDRPKPMADINGKPFLQKIIDKYKNHNIYISVGYMKDYIKDYFKDKALYIEENSPLGTGGAIKKAFNEINSEYLIVVNGDTYTDFNIPSNLETKKLYICAVYMDDCERYGRFEISNNSISFQEKGCKGGGFINAGVYIVNKKILENQPESFSFEDVIKEYNDKEVLLFNSYFIDIGVPEDYEKAKKYFS